MKQKLLLKTMLLLFALIAGSSSVWAQTTIWSEDFSSYSADDVPTGGTYSYACANGQGTSPGTTKIYNQNTGGGTAPELMVGKKGSGEGAKGGSFTAVIPLDKYEGTLTLKYKQNAYGLKVTMTAETATNNQTKATKAEQTLTLTGVTASMTSVTIVFEATTTSNVRLDDIVLTGTKASSVATPIFTPAEGTYTSAQSVAITCATAGSTIYYTTNGSTPTSSSTEYTSAIPVSSTTTIKAIAKKGDDYSPVASATYTIVSFEHAGTDADPYTVADARTAIDNNIGITGVYATGIVSEIVTAYNETYQNISFNISTDGKTTSDQLQAYRCVGATGIDVSKVQVGDEVVVSGNLKKHNDTYEFDQNCELVSLTHSSEPIIVATPTSLTGFTYGVGSGPSDAQTISVEGSNLTASISLSLGESSNFEMSLSEGSGYTNSLTLTQTASAVAATTIYIRLKAGLAVNASYEGTVTLTSTGATDKAVSLTGSVTQPNLTWDLSTNSYDASPTEDQVIWSGSYATMTNKKASSSNAANNYLGGDANNRTSTRFYAKQILTIAPTSGYAITSIEFTATSDNYATALEGSTWSNASASKSSTTVTVTPTNGALPISATIGGTCGFTAVKVYYGVATSVTLTPAKTYTTLTSSHNLDFSSVSSDLEAYIATGVSGGYVTLTQVNKVPAGTGLVLKAATPDSPVSVPVFDGTSADDVSANKMAGSATATTAVAANAGYILKDGVFQPSSGGDLPAGKAYLNITYSPTAPVLNLNFGDGNTTSVSDVRSKIEEGRGEFYNLNGQRVAQPAKGLYIVNGKKYVVK